MIDIYSVLLFYKNISRTTAASSTNFGSILIFASCVVGNCNILCEGVSLLLLLKYFVFMLVAVTRKGRPLLLMLHGRE